MAMNRKLIGRSYAPSIYEVKEEAMIKYALATNETNARLLDSSCAGGLIAPRENEYPIVGEVTCTQSPRVKSSVSFRVTPTMIPGSSATAFGSRQGSGSTSSGNASSSGSTLS